MSQEFLSAFSPRQLSQETLEDLFVAREEIAQKLLQAVKDSAQPGVKRHSLIVGPRGMGKTHLLSVLYHRLRADEALKDRVRIARLSEEEYGLLTFFHVLHRTLNVLADTYEDPALKQAVADLRGLPVKEAQPRAEAILKDWLGDRTLLILAENLDDIFKQLKDAGQRALRAFLQTQQQTLLLVTTPSLAHSLTKHAAPFYGFFEVTHLKELDATQGRDLLIRLAKRHSTNADALVARLQAPDALPKLRAVEHLAGGHPRLWFLFSDVLAESPLDDLTAAFRKLIDQLTPYYQSKMKDGTLSDQERAIVETIALRREPVSVKEIAADCFLEPNVVSAHLSRISEDRYIRPERAGRESFYELSEPMLRLVLETRATQDEYLPTLLEFLAAWYTKSELEGRIICDDKKSVNMYISKALSLKIKNLNEVKNLKLSARRYVGNGKYEKALDKYSKIIQKKGADATSDDWIGYGLCLDGISDYKSALIAYENAISINNNAYAWSRKACSLMSLKKYNDALTSIDIALGLVGDDELLWFSKGEMLTDINRFDDAIKVFSIAMNISDDLYIKNSYVYALNKLGRYDEAIVMCEEIIKINGDDVRNLDNYGNALLCQGRYEEALSCCDKLMDIVADKEIMWANRGRVLKEMGEIDEAIHCYDKSLDLEFNIFALTSKIIVLIENGKWNDVYNEVKKIDVYKNGYHNSDYDEVRDFFIVILDGFVSGDIESKCIDVLIESICQVDNIDLYMMGVVFSIPYLISDNCDLKYAEIWFGAWVKRAHKRKKMQICLKFLEVSIEWKRTRSRKALLKLSIEERKIMEAFLPLEARGE